MPQKGKLHLISVIALITVINPPISAGNDTLVLVHVMFRHGDRTPNGKSELYPNDPHINRTYFPIGPGQLTNKGKQKCYDLGKELRSKYDKLLGTTYYPGLVEATSTDRDRTKTSLQYLLAGLFPPNEQEKWNENLNWQAVPIRTVKKSEDRVLLGVEFPDYFQLYTENRNSPRFQEEFKKHKQDFEYISEHSGLDVTSYWEIYLVYWGIFTELEYGLKLPKWLEKIWPERFTKLAVKQYSMATATAEMNKLSSGYFLKKILDDTMEIIDEGDTQFKRKLYLYSAHDCNMAMLLLTLKIFNNQMPKYGSYVAFEVHQIDGVYGFKVYYQNYDCGEAVLMKLPGGKEFCPLEEFRKLFSDVLPGE